VDDSTIILAAADNLKTLHLVWQEDAKAAPVDWALKAKKSTDDSGGSAEDQGAVNATASPNLLYVNDSRTVQFTGSALSGFTSFVAATFDGATKVNGSYSKDTLKPQIPSALTVKPGTKEITVTLGTLDPKTKKTTNKTVTVSILVVQK
jgi:hypothetical protein